MDIFIGIFFLIYTTAGAISIAFVIAFWVFFSGILDIGAAFSLKSAGFSGWWMTLVSGIFGAIAGFILITSPAGLTAWYVSLIISIYLFMIGVECVGISLTMGSVKRKLQ